MFPRRLSASFQLPEALCETVRRDTLSFIAVNIIIIIIVSIYESAENVKHKLDKWYYLRRKLL